MAQRIITGRRAPIQERLIMSNEQKVAIVTGASQGIGAGAVKAYRDNGFVVVANSPASSLPPTRASSRSVVISATTTSPPMS
jgi:hypothetical protein